LEGAAALAVAVASWSLAPSLVSRAASRTRIDPLGFNGWRMLVAALATLPLAVGLEGFPHTVPWADPMFELGVWLGGVRLGWRLTLFFLVTLGMMGLGLWIGETYIH